MAPIGTPNDIIQQVNKALRVRSEQQLWWPIAREVERRSEPR